MKRNLFVANAGGGFKIRRRRRDAAAAAASRRVAPRYHLVTPWNYIGFFLVAPVCVGIGLEFGRETRPDAGHFFGGLAGSRTRPSDDGSAAARRHRRARLLPSRASGRTGRVSSRSRGTFVFFPSVPGQIEFNSAANTAEKKKTRENHATIYTRARFF